MLSFRHGNDPLYAACVVSMGRCISNGVWVVFHSSICPTCTNGTERVPCRQKHILQSIYRLGLRAKFSACPRTPRLCE